MFKKISYIVLFSTLIYTPLFAQLNYNYITDFDGNIPNNTKEIIAWHSQITEKGDTITSKSEYWQYDKNKNLVFWHEPKIYCYVKKEYNKQNQLIALEKMCGESSDNGYITISYPSKNTIIEQHGLSGYAALTKIQNSYNQKKQLIRKEIYDSLYDEVFNPSDNKYEIYHSVIVYKYDKNDNLIEEKIFDLPQLTTSQTTKYTYNKDKQILRKETNSKNKNGSFNTSIIKYNYYGYLHKGEKKPKIFNINTTQISDYSTESYIQKYTYYQKNIIETETTHTSTYLDNTDTNVSQKIYKNNRLIRKKFFSTPQKKQDRKITSWIDYQYIFY